MTRSLLLVVFVLVAIGPMARSAKAQTAAATALPSPLGLADVVRIAGEQRAEILTARARVRVGEARPEIVSALEDPMLSPSLDHLPFMLTGADVSITIEQRLPLSGIRRHRRASALAGLDRVRAEVNRTTLDVGIQAANAFLMLQARRRTATQISEQIAFARAVVTAANARYASGTAPQSDVLRAEVEVARLDALARGLVGEVRAAEAMLNASLGQDAESAVPELAPLALTQPGTGGDRARRSGRAGDA
jgi:outer membrane protein, heavy metal efflux system